MNCSFLNLLDLLLKSDEKNVINSINNTDNKTLQEKNNQLSLLNQKKYQFKGMR